MPEFWPGEFHGLYSPWGCKELDTTERLSLSLSLSSMLCYVCMYFGDTETGVFNLTGRVALG